MTGSENGATSGVTDLLRPRYVPRQLVTAADLTAEQEFLRERRRLHNRFLHGCGVVCGLDVLAEPGTDGARASVRVTAGYALTPEGEEVAVPQDHTLPVGPARADECLDTGEREVGRLFLALGYREELAYPVPAAPERCQPGALVCEHARTCVGYRFAWLDELPQGCARLALDCDAALRDLIDLTAPSSPPEASQLFACPPTARDGWVVLAAVDRHGQGSLTVDYAPRSTAPSVHALAQLVRCLAGAPPAPSITAIAPTEALAGTEVTALISGQRLAGTTAVDFSDTGIDAVLMEGGTDTSVPVRLSIADEAEEGPRTFTLTTPAGAVSSGSLVFTVLRPAPQILAIVPAEAQTGTGLSATISGQGLAGATAVKFSGTGVVAAVLPGGNDRSLPVRINVDDGAAEGERTFSVAVPRGEVDSGSVTFGVRRPAPAINAIFPDTGTSGTTIELAEISGQGLAGALAVSFSGTGLIGVILPGGTDLTVRVRIVIASGAAAGARTFTVDTPRGAIGSGSVVFTVNRPRPSISVIEPTQGQAGTTIDALITGTGLSDASEVDFSGTGVQATIRAGGTDGRVPIRIAIDSTAPEGARSFSVQTPAGLASGGSLRFTVLRPPRISRITPAVITAGSTTIGEIAGMGLEGATSVAFRPAGPSATIRAGGTDVRLPIRISVGPLAPEREHAFVVRTPARSLDSADFGVTLAVTGAGQIRGPIPVGDVPGIGPAREARLSEAGVRNLAELAGLEPGELARLLGMSEGRARAVLDEARRRLEEPP
jgi:hypothetical protein